MTVPIRLPMAAHCPACGSVLQIESDAGRCRSCHYDYSIAGNKIVWRRDLAAEGAFRRKAILKSLLDPLANPYSPITSAVRRVVESYYQRTLNDANLAGKFQEYFMRGIATGNMARVLDHGCGRGRSVGLLSQLGFDVSAQDVAANPWWEKFPNARFQVVSPQCRYLPWPSGHFGVVLDFLVIEYFDRERLAGLAAEVKRVLKPGGYWILWCANPTGRGAAALQPPFVHHPHEVETLASKLGFELIDRRYDGVAARFFPRLQAAIKTIRAGRQFDYFSYGNSAAERAVVDREKSTYTIRLRT